MRYDYESFQMIYTGNGER